MIKQQVIESWTDKNLTHSFFSSELQALLEEYLEILKMEAHGTVGDLVQPDHLAGWLQDFISDSHQDDCEDDLDLQVARSLLREVKDWQEAIVLKREAFTEVVTNVLKLLKRG